MTNDAAGTLASFIPVILMSVGIAISAHFLAKDKGRNVALWTFLALIPVVNVGCIWFFMGASNLRMERKIDALLNQLNVTGKES